MVDNGLISKVLDVILFAACVEVWLNAHRFLAEHHSFIKHARAFIAAHAFTFISCE